jgi:hypothetical protein
VNPTRRGGLRFAFCERQCRPVLAGDSEPAGKRRPVTAAATKRWASGRPAQPGYLIGQRAAAVGCGLPVEEHYDVKVHIRTVLPD